jgi:hypothetical protein
LNGDAEETEKYLRETVVQNLDTGNYDNDKALTAYLQRDDLIQGRVDEVKACINRMRKTQAALKKKK